MQSEAGKKAVVVGLGASGMAAVRYLKAHGYDVCVSESRPRESLSAEDLSMLNSLDVDMETGGHTSDFFDHADMIVPSPGVPLDVPVLEYARKKGIEIVGELALAAGKINAPVIAVTGSNGKTTVTSLIGHLLQKTGKKIFVGGNIGTPVLEYLRGDQWAGIVVLELSSFQLEIAGSFRPDVAILLNISPDHLDRHGTIEQYAAAKLRIFANQHQEDIAVLPTDDPMLLDREVPAGIVLRFGTSNDATARINDKGVMISISRPEGEAEEFYDLTGTSLSSFVNRLNAAVAILAARVVGCQDELIRAGLHDYVPPAHRMSLVGEIGGVRYIDDSKGTNIGAVQAALASNGDRIILIAGGRDKKSDFSLLAPAVREHVIYLVLLGEAAGRIKEALGSIVQTVTAGSMEEAVRMAAERAQPGDTVMLSPGCASFDMFTGYAHRGEVFRQAVSRLEPIKQEIV